MRQLGELGKNKDKFEECNAEVIAVFREDQKGEEGLKIIQKKTETPFTLALDMNNERTARYSNKKGEFTGYVINKEGVITSIFEGNLRNRAKSKELIDAIKAASGSKGSSKKEDSDSKGSDKK